MKDLFLELDEAYKNSDIINHKSNDSWYYSLCTSKPIVGQPVIVGFNWGVSSDHKKQSINDLQKEIDWSQMASLKRIKPYVEDCFPNEEIKKFNSTNYCLFRSSKESQISSKDIELSQPIFFEFLERVKPKFILGFSAKLKDILMHKGLIKYLNEKRIFDGAKTTSVYHGFMKVGKSWTYIYLLPHPRYWNSIKNHDLHLKDLWKVCINTNPYELWLVDFLNYLEEKDVNPQIHENPLELEGFRNLIFDHDSNISISNISVLRECKPFLEKVKEFDINDITALLRSWPKEMNKWNSYLSDKNAGKKIDLIIDEHFDKNSFDWTRNIVKLGFQKLYIYSKYYDLYLKFKKEKEE